jgi:protein arginine kinase activator
MKCDNCAKDAKVHLTEIRSGQKIEKHLCEQCAAKQGELAIKPHTPINELLSNFVQQQVLNQVATAVCEHCGMTWAEFRSGGLFGCQHDYDLFEKDLTPLLQRAHEGATHHVGKKPVRLGGGGPGPAGEVVPGAEGAEGTKAVRKPGRELSRLRQELERAVENEDYERAAELRDKIRHAERGE